MGDLRDERATELPTYTRGTDLGAWWELHLAGGGR